MVVVWGAVGVVAAIGALVWIWVVTGPPADTLTDRGGALHRPEPSDPPSAPP
jgi:hypothetical protein